jgi:hypothetical protein
MNCYRRAYLHSGLPANKVKAHPVPARPLPKREGWRKVKCGGGWKEGLGKEKHNEAGRMSTNRVPAKYRYPLYFRVS